MPADHALHPEAAKSLDAAAEKLMDLFAVEPLEVQTEGGPFSSRKHVGGPITDKDMIGEPLLGWSDITGNTVGRYFVLNRQQISLKGPDYVELRRLSDRVLATKPFRTGLSQTFVEDEIFIWCRARYRNEIEEGFSSYLLRRMGDEVRAHHLIVPIASIEIERPFKLGDVQVTTLSPELFDKALAYSRTKAPDDAQEHIAAHFDKLKRKHVGSAAVEVELTGEKRFVEDQAYAIASDMAAILRFLSPLALSSTVAFPCYPAGEEHMPSRTIFAREGDGLSIHSALLHNGIYNYKMSFSELDEKMRGGLANLAAFFGAAPLTEHQKRVRGALLAYSRGIGSYDPNDRLLYAMTAAEHLLLRDASEPIQGNVGERMAFVIFKAPDDRKAVVSTFKRAYQLRSQYVHHLVSVEDDEALQAFFRNMWLLLFAAVANMGKFKSQADFLDAIDRVKFS
jgi:hypothetical protein